MTDKTVRKRGAGWLVLLAVASFAAQAREVDHLLPDDDPLVVKDVDPADYHHLDGVWWCRFLKAKSKIERDYYSVWTFRHKQHQVDIFYSPVHKGFTYGYRWDGKQLVIGSGSGPLRMTYSTHKTQIQVMGRLAIEDPRLRWKGWWCSPQPGVRWPPDGLQFLDYARYPWLSGLIEDGHEIMKYRDPKQYEEWLKSAPR